MNSHDALDGATPCARTEALLDAYVAGDVDAQTAQRLDAHQATCPRCAEAVQFARSMHGALSALPVQACPPQVTRNVYRAVRTQKRAALRTSLRHRLVQGMASVVRPALAVAVVVMAFWWIRPQTAPPPVVTVAEPTQAEVAQALHQLKWTMGYVSGVGHKAGVLVRQDVLLPHVAHPIHQSMEGVLVE